MFIYSNHHLIFSQLTREDYKDYFNFYKFPGLDLELYDLKANTFAEAEIEDVDYYSYDFIDLGIYFFENKDFIKIERDPIMETFLTKKRNRQEHDQEDSFGRKRLVINDMSYYSTGAIEPLMHNEHWVKGGRYYVDKNATLEEQEKQEFHVVRDCNKLHLPSFKEELVDFRLFPEDKENAYYLNETYNFIENNNTAMVDKGVTSGQYEFEIITELMEYFCRETNKDNAVKEVWYYDEDPQDGELNYIHSINMCVDDDSPEYWHEPLFIFPLIREIDCFRPIFRVKPQNIFDRFYTSPCNNEWHENSEFDPCLGRNNVC